MKLFIAEKPSVAKAISSELGILKRVNGYFECKGNCFVTWCFGHLLEQAEPDQYLSEDIPLNKKGKKIWRLEDLPIFPGTWKLVPKDDKGVKAQLKTIKALLNKATTVVNCGDPDREGQLLIDEILDYFRNKKTVQRFWASAQDPISIRRALQNLKPNSQFFGMKQAALGRSRADWLIGMNLTRLYTLVHSSPNNKILIAVGRVQTPTLALVAARDALIKNFKPVPFYAFKASAKVDNLIFQAQWVPNDSQSGLDSQKRLIDKIELQKLQEKFANVKTATVSSCTCAPKKTNNPKPYSLADIQLEASNKYGFSAEQTLNVCQSLYEKHKLTSYPRSDCQYLPESQFADAKHVLEAVSSTHSALTGFVRKADPSIRTEVWNDKKITAHHGIIPTQQKGSWGQLTKEEQIIYELIAKRYIAQFFPPYEYLETKVELCCANEQFRATGKNTLKEGWKLIYQKEESCEESSAVSNQEVPSIKKGEVVQIKQILTEQNKTTPPSAYTEGTLISAMEKIHTVVKEPEIKKYLKETDGIGTPATRAAIISELKRKGYLEVNGKKVHATNLGTQLLALVPTTFKNPILTAMFERRLKEVEAGQSQLDSFIDPLKKMICGEIEKLQN